MRTYKLLLLLAVALLPAGCCTKEDCNGNWNWEEFRLTYPGPVSLRKIYRYDSTCTHLLDSVDKHNEFTDGRIRLDIRWLLPETDGTTSTCALVVATSTKRDTLHRIRYRTSRGKISCGTCFPFGSRKVGATFLSDFTLQYKGRKYSFGETVPME